MPTAPARGLGCLPASAAAGWREPSGHALLSRSLSCRLPDRILSLCLLLACVVSGADMAEVVGAWVRPLSLQQPETGACSALELL